jgi:cyclopropane fatty-acyl-phospholipid synthase-like methyltransferase
MNNYWEIHFDSNSKTSDGSLFKQVGKTVNGLDVAIYQINLIVENIANALQLKTSDTIIDLCCGNGLITRQLAPLVKKIDAVDFSSSLIDIANEFKKFPNISYITSDVLNLTTQYLSGSNKVVMYEALQHFSFNQMEKLTEKLSCLETGALIFFGSIPDKSKLKNFYDTDKKYAFFLERERESRPHMGRWWTFEEIEHLASAHGFKTKHLHQDSLLYTSHYRFDVLFEKC